MQERFFQTAPAEIAKVFTDIYADEYGSGSFEHFIQFLTGKDEC